MNAGILASASGCVLRLMFRRCDQMRGGKAKDGPSNGSATAARYYKGPKPEGVPGPNDAVILTFQIPQAAISDMYEIEAAELARGHAHASEVKASGRMSKDKRKSNKALRRFIAKQPVNIPAPNNIDPRRSPMLANLKGTGPAEFDAVYVARQAAAHEAAFHLHSSYARRGDHPASKHLARKKRPNGRPPSRAGHSGRSQNGSLSALTPPTG